MKYIKLCVIRMYIDICSCISRKYKKAKILLKIGWNFLVSNAFVEPVGISKSFKFSRVNCSIIQWSPQFGCVLFAASFTINVIFSLFVIVICTQNTTHVFMFMFMFVHRWVFSLLSNYYIWAGKSCKSCIVALNDRCIIIR